LKEGRSCFVGRAGDYRITSIINGFWQAAHLEFSRTYQTYIRLWQHGQMHSSASWIRWLTVCFWPQCWHSSWSWRVARLQTWQYTCASLDVCRFASLDDIILLSFRGYCICPSSRIPNFLRKSWSVSFGGAESSLGGPKSA